MRTVFVRTIIAGESLRFVEFVPVKPAVRGSRTTEDLVDRRRELAFIKAGSMYIRKITAVYSTDWYLPKNE